MNALLSTTYFGPVQWYQKLHRADMAWIEGHERFQKQTYRNRCTIATANGPQTLSVPVVHQEGGSIRDVRISDHGNWRHVHWNALASAYGESAFFLYYADELRPFFERKWEFLFDFNMEITMKMCEWLDIKPHMETTRSFAAMPEKGVSDFRQAINPKHPASDDDFHPTAYYQVYAGRQGFLPNMSILDLIFNMGNESIFWL